MKKLYLFIECQNFNLNKILSDPKFIDVLSNTYGEAAKNRCPCIYFQKWGSEMEESNIKRNIPASNIIEIIQPSNPFIIEYEYLYKFISPIGNRNIIIRYDEYFNQNTYSVLDNLLENSKLEIQDVEIFGLKDSNNIKMIKAYLTMLNKNINIIETIL
jgi:hypothetical protein